MLTFWAKRLTNCVLQDSASADQRAICEYGCELWLYTIFSTAGLMLIGILFIHFLETALIIGIFYLCQSNGGGFHAKTHWRCFFTMLIGLLGALCVLHIPMICAYLPSLSMASIIVLLVNPLRLHPNKMYLMNKATLLKRRSYCVTLLIAIGMLFLYATPFRQLFYAGCISIILSALSRLSARSIKR